MILHPYDPKNKSEPYQVKVYKTEGGELKPMAVYAMGSARFALWDGITKDGKPTGGMIENDSGLINAVMYYDARITHIGILHNGRGTRMKVPMPRPERR